MLFSQRKTEKRYESLKICKAKWTIMTKPKVCPEAGPGESGYNLVFLSKSADWIGVGSFVSSADIALNMENTN